MFDCNFTAFVRAKAAVPMLIICAAAIGCNTASPAALKESPPPTVIIERVTEQDIHEFDEFTGRLQARETIDVRARVRGHLVEVNFNDGKFVQPGDVLFKIDDRTYQATYDQAVARRTAAVSSRDLAQTNLDRTKLLFAKQVATQQDMDTITAQKAVADAEVAKAEADVAAEKLNVDFCTIKAEIAGRVSRALVTKGNLVNTSGAETLLTTIVSVDPIYVYFDVDENAVQHYRAASRAAGVDNLEHISNAKIPLTLALGTDDRFHHEGIIDFVDNRVDPSTGTIVVRGVLPNPNVDLLPGYFAKVRVVQRNASTRGVLVPDRAIATDLSTKYVLVVGEDNVVQSRPVTVGRLQDKKRIVRTGLKDGDRVIVSGLQRARPGGKVAPQEEKVAVPKTTAAVN